MWKKNLTRRKVLFFGAASFLASAFPFLRGLASTDRKEVLYLKNDSLPVIRHGYKGNAFVDGRFVNEAPRPDIPFSKIMKWRMNRKGASLEKERDTYRPVVHPGSSMFEGHEDMIVWLGHATFFIRLDGVTFLTDPCLKDIVMVKRYIGTPCEPEEIKHIDYLLVSHTHRDHLDEATMKSLNLKGTKALVPLRMGGLVSSMNGSLSVQEAGWYQRFSTGRGHPEVYLLPAQHWSQRFFRDTNQVLWGSYVIRGKNRTLYFAGDSAYAPHFGTIGSLFPDIDLCLMPIGAYRPGYIMKGSHLSPRESLDAFHDLGGKTLVPMHYGTYDLADDTPGEPVRAMENLHRQGKINGQLQFLDVGGMYRL